MAIHPTLSGGAAAATLTQLYEYEETRALVRLVTEAADLVRTRGDAALDELRTPDSHWRRGESYVFVLDPDGTMLVHPDPSLEGHEVLGLEDVNGRPIIRGLIDAAMRNPDRPEGWYHYQWPVPGGLLPLWKSTYVVRVHTPAGENRIVGSGVYTERMERAFVVDAVTRAAELIRSHGERAFPLLRNRRGPFVAKDAYVFVVAEDGTELVNPAFPTLEGRSLLDVQDAHGRYVHREFVDLVRTRGSGWMDYMWPRPGESSATQKATYVVGANLGERRVIVGCGVYLPDAPKAARAGARLRAPELMKLVREGAALLEERGADAYAEFRRRGSRWFHDDTYLFVCAMDGTRVFHAAEPDTEGRNDSELRDVLGRPIVRMILDVASAPAGEGWVHYLYPEPGGLFPAWKSSFVRRVTDPSGARYVLGCGVYGMEMDRAFIEDLVARAAAVVATRGRAAFPDLRDRTGPFMFMDTYVFVQSPDGTEVVNPAFPALEGRNLMDLKDLTGRAVIRDEIEAAMQKGSVWLELQWYRPGSNAPATKQTYVRRVDAPDGTWLVGSGIYAP